jgi:hypothetical protein
MSCTHDEVAAVMSFLTPLLPSSHRELSDDEIVQADELISNVNLLRRQIYELVKSSEQSASEYRMQLEFLGIALAKENDALAKFCQRFAVNCSGVDYALKMNLFDFLDDEKFGAHGTSSTSGKKYNLKHGSLSYSTSKYSVNVLIGTGCHRGRAHMSVESDSKLCDVNRHIYPESLLGSLEDIALQFFLMLPPGCKVTKRMQYQERPLDEDDHVPVYRKTKHVAKIGPYSDGSGGAMSAEFTKATVDVINLEGFHQYHP